MAVLWALLGLQAGFFVSRLLGALWALQRPGAPLPPTDSIPGVSIIKPVKSLSFQELLACQSWLSAQPFPVEVIFSFQDPHDPSLPQIRRLARHSRVPVRIVANPIRPGMNAKASNLFYGVLESRHPWLVFSDSDIRAAADTLPRLVAPLGSPEVGLVAALPRPVNPRTAADHLISLGWVQTGTMIWLPLTELGLAVGAPGASMAIRKETLHRIGGVEAFGRFVAEDKRLGQLIQRHGYRLLVGPQVDMPVQGADGSTLWHLLRRGAFMIRHMDGVLGMVSSLLIQYGVYLVALLALLLLKGPVLLGAVALLLAEMGGLSLLYLRMGRPSGEAFLLPVLDFLFLAALLDTIRQPRLVWRNVTYEVGSGGELMSEEEAESGRF